MRGLYPTFRAGMDDTPEDLVWNRLSQYMNSDFPLRYPANWLGMFARLAVL